MPGARAGFGHPGAVEAGLYPDVPTAAGRMVHVRSQIRPNPEAHEAYKFYVQQYIDTYPPLRDGRCHRAPRGRRK
ncbi:MAG: hypothetical protein R3A10_11615 [Caldilineaceae bacterium]